jgi:hypothetical protein
MIDPIHFRDEIIKPTLQYMGPPYNSPAAVNLLLGTAVVESKLTYLRQLGGGPALGLYQIEPATLTDVYKNYLDYRPDLRERLHRRFINQLTGPQKLVGNLHFATMIARLIYYRAPGALPEAHDLHGLADYWKAHYNTEQGAGDPDEFVRAFPKRGI